MIQASSRKKLTYTEHRETINKVHIINWPSLKQCYRVNCIVNNAVLSSFEFLTLCMVLGLFTGVFKVPARYICGYDPCSGAICKSDPTARCLVDHSCKSIFVNSFNQRMGSCKGEPIPSKKYRTLSRKVPVKRSL